MIIREAKLRDATELASLIRELGYETTPTEMKTRLKSILPNSTYKTFVAVVDDRICGMIGTLEHPSYEHDDSSGRILALVTSRTMRRRGRGINHIALDTRVTRKDAHQFYEALGYDRNGWRFVKIL